MARDPLIEEVAGAVQASVRLLVQRLRQTEAMEGEPTSAEMSAMSRLDRTGPTTSADLARLERISPQSMGATVAALEEAGLVSGAPHPADGRQIILSLTATAREWIKASRAAREDWLSQAIRSHLSPAEQEDLAKAAALLRRLVE